MATTKDPVPLADLCAKHKLALRSIRGRLRKLGDHKKGTRFEYTPLEFAGLLKLLEERANEPAPRKAQPKRKAAAARAKAPTKRPAKTKRPAEAKRAAKPAPADGATP